MIKAIATDLDGTLFYPKTKLKLIYPMNTECIKHFLGLGKELILVTGRNYSIAKKVEKAIDMDSSLSLVGCNGAIVVHKGEVIAEHAIDKDKIDELIKDLIDNKEVRLIFFMGSFEGMIIVPTHMTRLEIRFGKIAFRLQGAYYEKTSYGLKKLKKVLEDDNNRLYKIMPVYALGNSGAKGCERAVKNLEILKAKYGDSFEFATSTTAVEITAKGVTKGNALKELLEKYDIENNEVAVVGDSGNDVPMFEAFEESYVMKHAHKSVRKKAKHEIYFWNELKKYID